MALEYLVSQPEAIQELLKLREWAGAIHWPEWVQAVYCCTVLEEAVLGSWLYWTNGCTVHINATSCMNVNCTPATAFIFWLKQWIPIFISSIVAIQDIYFSQGYPFLLLIYVWCPIRKLESQLSKLLWIEHIWISVAEARNHCCPDYIIAEYIQLLSLCQPLFTGTGIRS